MFDYQPVIFKDQDPLGNASNLFIFTPDCTQKRMAQSKLACDASEDAHQTPIKAIQEANDEMENAKLENFPRQKRTIHDYARHASSPEFR